MKTLAERATVLLRGLGDTPEEIAAMLLGAGYKGDMISPTACPCGACLRDHLGETVYVFGTMGRGPNAVVSTDVSWAIAEFVERFDAGEFPELVEEG